jgi:HPt (histidine-containing phosphotransfer) domain-containing protein
VDITTLALLHDELEGNDLIWGRFIQDFVARLPHRVERLLLTLTRGDIDDVMDAVLSIRTSSQMVGAARLATLSRDLEQAIDEASRHSDTEEVLTRLGETRIPYIKACAQQTGQQLQKHLAGTQP